MDQDSYNRLHVCTCTCTTKLETLENIKFGETAPNGIKFGNLNAVHHNKLCAHMLTIIGDFHNHQYEIETLTKFPVM